MNWFEGLYLALLHTVHSDIIRRTVTLTLIIQNFWQIRFNVEFTPQ